MSAEDKHHLADGLRRAYDDSQESQARDIIALGIRKLSKGAGARRGSGGAAKTFGRGAASATAATAAALGKLSRTGMKMKIPGLKR